MKSRKAFTLVELLVVIAVIGILSAVIAISTNSSKIKARDAQRKGDLLKIGSALEIYRTDNKSYPASNCEGLTWTVDDQQFVKFITTYLPTIPHDPTSPTSTKYNEQYTYITDVTAPICSSAIPTKAVRYALYAYLERPSSQDTATVPASGGNCPAYKNTNFATPSPRGSSPSFAVVGNCK